MAGEQGAEGLTVVGNLRDLAIGALGAALEGVRRVALVGFPDHNNIGDSAIWVGTRQALADLGVDVAYIATWWSYSPDVLQDAVGDAPVLIHGGGNLGDRYRNEQDLRERVLGDLRDRLILQLPQTVSFADQSKARAFAGLALRHPNFRVMVRDNASGVALDRLGLSSSLVPDLAFAIRRTGLPNAAKAQVGDALTPGGDDPNIVWIARTDEEQRSSAAQFARNSHVRMTDWQDLLGPPDTWPDEARSAVETVRGFAQRSLTEARLAVRAARRVAGHLGVLGERPSFGRAAPNLGDLADLSRGLDLLANFRLDRGLELLSTASVVITDRLHAHVLSLLSGIPSVVYDNTDHKLSRYWETWSPPASLAQWADTPEVAWEYASPR